MACQKIIKNMPKKRAAPQVTQFVIVKLKKSATDKL